MPKSVLIVDDSPDMGVFVAKVARGLQLDVSVTDNADDFKKNYEANEPDIIVLDIVMPNVDGLELLHYLADRNCRSRILVMTGYNEIYLRHAKSLGELYGLPFVETLMKPIELPDIEKALLGDA